MAVTVVHVTASLMNQQLDAAAAELLRASLERRGLRILLSRQTAAIEGEGRVQALRFADGEDRRPTWS
jgi:nitrite reductase (NADH) large subunit